MFLTHHHVPDEIARSCEEKLFAQGFHSPQILVVVAPSQFQCDYLTSIGIAGRGLQYLLIRLKEELHSDREYQRGPLWTQKMVEAVAVGKKRARDTTEGAK